MIALPHFHMTNATSAANTASDPLEGTEENQKAEELFLRLSRSRDTTEAVDLGVELVQLLQISRHRISNRVIAQIADIEDGQFTTSGFELVCTPTEYKYEDGYARDADRHLDHGKEPQGYMDLVIKTRTSSRAVIRILANDALMKRGEPHKDIKSPQLKQDLLTFAQLSR